MPISRDRDTVTGNSLVSQAGTLVGVLIGIALSAYLQLEPGKAMALAVFCLLLAWIVVEGTPAARRAWTSRERRDEAPAIFWRRIGTKLVGLAALLGVVVIACSVFPFFTQSSAVQWFIEAGHTTIVISIALAAATILYIVATDQIAEEPDDYLHQVGRAVLMQDFRDEDVLFALRLLAIKCFFLVLMFSGGMAALTDLADKPAWAYPPLSAAWFEGLMRLVFLLDVVLAAGGYIATFKLFGWHVRATETTALGWLVCLICYEPLFPAISHAFVPYGDGPGWETVIQEGSAIFILWSVATLFCTLIYVWATVAFGPRFSNLTHRGIITTGPYRFIKHPAYVSKNISWWLFAFPSFIAGGLTEGLARAGMLAIVSLIYVMRARAEERMLSRDPAYRDYTESVATHGLLAMAKRRLAPTAPRV
ncbi:protein-S-isoprenylcysteine O-methyltransferase Ste14 [Rhizobium sp. BK077]|uniref:methyltransferase family protein n=1 Tax=unclassified Rhizobium TaxID=2613769 RepID=UPI001619FF82|nr:MULTISPECIES: isoprenylcysteine carboxylmethyltransferase family protein [unclassified Rhizobium]MBB3300227.1 protein-S-isoprenylcysteine O-methyltransferase Ste14 [Rhizobium sp. BK112]MBB3369684.1 protein-S-isoprenylcysteine O-methyltransferase Ste14 [Rhizobium sp. BK077]MBB4179771.1 protein-S-isoprenylcysteine O-methyltransferase Ste14 [Rhizobium sp. BK109]